MGHFRPYFRLYLWSIFADVALFLCVVFISMDHSASGDGAELHNSSIVRGIIVLPSDSDNLALCAAITVAIQMTFYLFACSCKSDKVTDFAGASNFVVLALATFVLSGTNNVRQVVITVLVTLWGARLAGYLLIRIIKIGKDKRFDQIRGNPIKFLIFWIFQIVWVYVVSLPVIFINSPIALQRDISVTDIVGAVIFLLGLFYETVADYQKFIFKTSPLNKDKWCDVGLWKVSRHPNYLGEICVWWGAFIVSSTILVAAKWLAVVSPLFVMLTLIFFTGIPPLERSADRKYGNDPDYKAYKSSTPPLLPGISSLYLKTPYCLKLIFCCEFPFYHSKPEAPLPSWEDSSVWDRGTDAISNQPRQSISSSGHSGILYTPTYTSNRNIF